MRYIVLMVLSLYCTFCSIGNAVENSSENKVSSISDFSKEGQILKFKAIDSRGSDVHFSYIARFSHSSVQDFNVWAFFLDADGFEIDRQCLGKCKGDTSLSWSPSSEEDQGLWYDMKGVFWLSSQITSRTSDVELFFLIN